MKKATMKKMDHKSGVTYVCNGYYNEMLDVSVLHISDDNCNEFTVVVFGKYTCKKGWQDASFLKNSACKAYDSNEWRKMSDNEEYYNNRAF